MKQPRNAVLGSHRVDGVENAFRFGVQLKNARDGEHLSRLVKRCEALGYGSVSLPDHLDEQLAPLPALAWMGAVTSSIQLSTLVVDNDFRNPVLLARDAATIASLTGGRFELGMGAGWKEEDYRRLGLQMEPASVRVRRLGEALEIVAALFRGEEVTFKGEFYSIEGATLGRTLREGETPKIVVGGGGARVLALAAKYADVIGINPRLTVAETSPDLVPEVTEEGFEEKVSLVTSLLRGFGRTAELQARTIAVHVGSDLEEILELGRAVYGVGAEVMTKMPTVLLGEAPRLIELLLERRERFGISYWIVHEDSIESFAPIVAELAGR